MTHGSDSLTSWSSADIDGECSKAWGSYDRELANHYAAYFEAHPELQGDQRYSAHSLEAALPDGWSGLEELIPDADRHVYHRSGKSSQALALGLLGPAARLDPSLRWLWDALAPLPPAGSDLPPVSFERPLDPTVLNERPRVTAIDCLIEAPDLVVCIEAKWREGGAGVLLLRQWRRRSGRRKLLRTGVGADEVLGRRSRAVPAS